MKDKLLISLAVVAALFTSQSAFASETYKVQVTRISKDLYRIEGQQKTFIKTAYCYEYATWQEAVLLLDIQCASGCINIGKLVFTDSKTSCQVDLVFR